MAPIKLEENIKDKLEKRTIQPSIAAWDQLSEDLNANDKKNKRGLIFYIGIAASIIGILLVTNIFFNASESQFENSIIVDIDIKKSKNDIEAKNENKTVEKEVVTNISEDNKDDQNVKEITSSIKNEAKLATKSNKTSIIEIENKVDNTMGNSAIAISETNQAVATLNSVNNKKEQSRVSTLTFEEAKAIEVVNQIKNLEIENGRVTDAEIENLLKQAERDILKDRLYNETTRTVDADALLQDVEDDLEKSFRTRVFEGLKSGFKTVKTAVAERNN